MKEWSEFLGSVLDIGYNLLGGNFLPWEVNWLDISFILFLSLLYFHWIFGWNIRIEKFFVPFSRFTPSSNFVGLIYNSIFLKGFFFSWKICHSIFFLLSIPIILLYPVTLLLLYYEYFLINTDHNGILFLLFICFFIFLY